ncbi:hypothetical protein TNCV_4265461 [Trichonephila clavipes]|nr:hypothetical protein TNCV_4265461 [Trichonephila clavipes]
MYPIIEENFDSTDFTLFAGNIVAIVRIDTSSRRLYVSGSNPTQAEFSSMGSNPYTGGIFVDGSLKNTPLHRTATAGSDVVQSGRPILDDFSNICGRISAITRRMLSSKWSSVCGLSA